MTRPLEEAVDIDSTISRPSSVDLVEERLRVDIIRGRIAPGERIYPNEVARRLGVSHIPVREAIRRLETQGLVMTTPQRATQAADIGLEDLAGLYRLRRIIEVAVAEQSTAILTGDDVHRVQDALRGLKSHADAPYSVTAWKAHREFHWSILAPAGNEWTRRIMEQLWQGVERYVSLAESVLGDFSRIEQTEIAMREHEGLADAFAEGDGALLARRLEDHLSATHADVVRAVQAMQREGD
jgi:DNA-binding GntR family transcriptional regulator